MISYSSVLTLEDSINCKNLWWLQLTSLYLALCIIMNPIKDNYRRLNTMVTLFAPQEGLGYFFFTCTLSKIKITLLARLFCKHSKSNINPLFI